MIPSLLFVSVATVTVTVTLNASYDWYDESTPRDFSIGYHHDCRIPFEHVHHHHFHFHHHHHREYEVWHDCSP